VSKVCASEVTTVRRYINSIIIIFIIKLRLTSFQIYEYVSVYAQISAYEAIQPIRSLTELRRRVGPYRRCYCLTHGALPREPLIVVHAALMMQISRTIQV